MSIIKPPFTAETAPLKVQTAEDAWNSRDPERVALAYSEDSEWRNRTEFLQGREAIKAFLRRKWSRELDYRLKKTLWGFRDNRMAVTFEYEWHDDSGQWYRSYGNELWEFDEQGLMRSGSPASTMRRSRSAIGVCISTGKTLELVGEFRREHIDALDHRRRGQQFGRLLPERSGHSSGEMSIPSGFVGECVEDAERGRTQTKAEPDRRCWLCLHQRETTPEECFDLRFLARLGLESNPQRNLYHVNSPIQPSASSRAHDSIIS